MNIWMVMKKIQTEKHCTLGGCAHNVKGWKMGWRGLQKPNPEGLKCIINWDLLLSVVSSYEFLF